MTIRYGIIGSGTMGVEHIQNINNLDDAEIVAIADPSESSLAWGLGESNDTPKAYADYRDLLAAGGIDAVVVSTPNMTHADVMDDVLAVDGLHVMIEKPLGTTVAECRRIMKAASDRSGLVWVALEYRYMPAAARLIEEVRKGTAGTVRQLSIREHRYPFLPKVGNWNRFNRNTGGTLVEKCCHFFDLMNLIIDSPPAWVAAAGAQDFNHLDEAYDEEVPDIIDAAYVIVGYENGVRAMLDLCMYAETTKHQEEIAAVGDLGKIEALTPGRALVGADPRQLVRIGDRASGRVEEFEVDDSRIQWEGGHHGGSYIEHLEFIKAIESGSPPEVGLEEGLMATAIGQAGHLSITEKRFVGMDEVLGERS